MGRPTKYEQVKKRLTNGYGGSTDAELYSRLAKIESVAWMYMDDNERKEILYFQEEYRKIMANEPVLIEGVTETVVEPIVETVAEPTKEATANGGLYLGGVALNKFIIHLEDASGNSLGSILHETELDNEAVRAWFEGEELLGLTLNNQYTGGVDLNLDGFSKPLRVVNLEKI